MLSEISLFNDFGMFFVKLLIIQKLGIGLHEIEFFFRHVFERIFFLFQEFDPFNSRLSNRRQFEISPCRDSPELPSFAHASGRIQGLVRLD